MATCSSCGATIEWARTASGKAIPLDVGPTPDGNLVVVGDVAVMRGASSGQPRQSHFASCPNARQHRRAR